MVPDGVARGGWPGSVLVTGAAGFIGANLVRTLVDLGVEVTALDNLSRPGSGANAEALRREVGTGLRFLEADVGDEAAVHGAVAGVDAIVHLAGQTAVTSAVADPRRDFLDNCVGTFHVLDAARRSVREPIVLYASTNKVYGPLDDLEVVEEPDRYRFADLDHGIDERRPVDLVSPYACSKGAGEQYVVDFARTYGVRTVAFRQSCVYGSHQLGHEDQGWLAWFVAATAADRPITIFGDGKQVRDLLHVSDLIACYGAAVANIDRAAGRVYNVGGGPANALAVWWQVREVLESAFERELPAPTFAAPRLGDQKVFVADCRKARDELGWWPTVAADDGIRRLVEACRGAEVPGAR